VDTSSGRGSGPGRVGLGTWPTPLEGAPRLAQRLGLDREALWIKRDDLTGLGAGGNKVRKLEYTCAAAVDRGATTLVTSGAAQSNHARLTAAAACRLGLGSVLVLAGVPPDAASGNLALEGLMGAKVVWAGPVDDAELDRQVEAVADELTRQGECVGVIPFGGSNVRGACGYLDCGRELAAQIPDLRHVVVAVGSGGTMAGLVAALGPDRVLGIDVGAVPDVSRRISRMLEGLADEGTMPLDFAGGMLRVRRDQVGDGYGMLTPAARDALIDAAQCEGIILDPVYTAKALSGLAAAVADGDIKHDECTVFIHTGGLPGLFGHDFMGDPQCVPRPALDHWTSHHAADR
jgi:L-cysteate sulfo-lyase